ncbi:MAG TPA: hypothetical protein VJQ54_05235 [Candidatus Sulfotelmatobacter sp.]|nr:hypothetical protein [Candidatus Sulfotelmatobacter sp.]
MSAGLSQQLLLSGRRRPAGKIFSTATMMRAKLAAGPCPYSETCGMVGNRFQPASSMDSAIRIVASTEASTLLMNMESIELVFKRVLITFGRTQRLLLETRFDGLRPDQSAGIGLSANSAGFIPYSRAKSISKSM